MRRRAGIAGLVLAVALIVAILLAALHTAPGASGRLSHPYLG